MNLRKTSFIALSLVAVALIVIIFFLNNKEQIIEKTEEIKKEVQTMLLADSASASLATVGFVKPYSEVDIIALAKGTLKRVYFAIGTYVQKDAVIAEIENETIVQSLETSRINLETAQNNLENTLSLQQVNEINQRENAVLSVFSYLNFIYDVLDKINYIIKAEGERQIDGISSVIAAKSSQSLINAKDSYFQAKSLYLKISEREATKEDVENVLANLSSLFKETKKALDDLIIVLENTVTNSVFTETVLSTQKLNFSSLRASLLSSYTLSENLLQNLLNLDLVQKKEADTLKNILSSAQNQFNIAKDNYDNLKIKSPISGRITQKFLEKESEVNPNQKIAVVAQTGVLKIESSLSKEDLSFLKIGQQVVLENDLKGVLSSIGPKADALTGKVKIEITFNNRDNLLLAGTFIDVEIPITDTDKIFVPLNALIITQAEKFVYLFKDGKAEKRKVETGNMKGSYIEIINGLKTEDEIIIEGNKNITDNEEIIKK